MPGEAVEARPWRTEDGPAPRVRTYPPGARPLLNVYTGGAWRRCTVLARQDWPTGRVSYQVEMTHRRDGASGTVVRAYWWDSKAMRPVRAESGAGSG